MKASATAARRAKSTRRAEILAAARAVFSARRFEDASVSEIASRAGCVEGTLYTYFRNKRDLLDSVLAEFYDRLIADIEPRFDAIHGTRDRLGFLVARHLQIAIDDPGVGRLIAREARGQSIYFGSKLHALNRRYSRFLLRTLSDGIARGELRPDLDLMLARDMLFGGLEHVVWSRADRQRNLDIVGTAEAIVRMLLEGWRVPGEAASVDSLQRRLDRLEARIGSAPRRRQSRGARSQ